MCYRQGDIDSAHPCLTTMYKSTSKQKCNYPGTLLVCSGEGTKQQVPGNHYVHLEIKEALIYGTTYRFQEEDAADGTSCVPSGPCRSTRQFPSPETQHGTIKRGTKSARTRQIEKKTLPQDYPRRLCVPSPSNRRQSGAKRRKCWQRRRPDVAYSSHWSGWPFSKRAGRISSPASQRPSTDSQ